MSTASDNLPSDVAKLFVGLPKPKNRSTAYRHTLIKCNAFFIDVWLSNRYITCLCPLKPLSPNDIKKQLALSFDVSNVTI